MINFSARLQQVQKWWSTPLGCYYIASLEQLLQQLGLLEQKGNLLCIGESSFFIHLPKTAERRVWVHTQPKYLADIAPIQARVDKLPILGDSFNHIYVAHALEFINNPHELLRESYRVLMPQGVLFIANFNPWSLWGLWRRGLKYWAKSPGEGRSISSALLEEWLSILGFEVTLLKHHCYYPPCAVEKMKSWDKWAAWGRKYWPFWGGGYVLVATKKVIPLTPIKPFTKLLTEVAADNLVQPACFKSE